MAFVLLLLLTISTLVRVESASASAGLAQLEARQAALLSLNVALGKLQETAGLDQRVTAPAESVASVNGVKQLTGVWRSWEGKDHQANGLPIAPDYGSKLESGELEIDSADDGRFLSWLVSSAYDPDNTAFNANANTPPSLLEDSATNTTVPLVGSGSVVPTVGSVAADVEVHLKPTLIDDGDAAIAWWISGENTKALLQTKETPNEALGWSERMASSAGPDASVFGITKLDYLDRVFERNDYNLLSNGISAGNTLSQTYFHDLTGYARGLLTNTANGGWRRDLSLMAEQWGTLENPDGGADSFPLYTLSPGQETQALKNSGAVGGLIYPWAAENDYQLLGGSSLGGASVGWSGLVDFALQYEQISSGSASGAVLFESKRGQLADGTGRRRDALGRRPVLARVHWVFSFVSEVDTVDPEKYNAYLNVSPVLTLWNPYNVAITGYSSFKIRFSGDPLPYSFQFDVGGSQQALPYELQVFADWSNFNFNVSADEEAWMPGETRVYSPVDRAADGIVNKGNINIERGYRPDSGFRWPIYESYTNIGNRFVKPDGPLMGGAADAAFTVSVAKLSNDYRFHFQTWDGDAADGVHHFYKIPNEKTNLYWPDQYEIINDSQTLGSTYADGPDGLASPFFVAVCQLRNVSVNSTGAKGYSQNKPIIDFSSEKIKGELVPDALPDAYPYDWVFFAPNGINDTEALPQGGEDAEDAYGFVGTSFRADQGLRRLMVAEVPTRPLRSMGELQHFDVGYYNPFPPYTANPIGNSHASFQITPDQVFIANGYAESMQASYDHSYVANHLLFDDWFISSIAPELSAWSANEDRDTEQVYSDFISENAALPNAAYLPAKPVSDTDEADGLAASLMADNAAWHRVASQIEVEGMFNVNSTSVEAWTALLKHLDGGDAPYASIFEDGWTVQLDSDTGNPVSRTTVTGDPNAPDAPDAATGALGTRLRLSDTQMKALATEIVEQVKERGPFLSLSEFMNRRLTVADTDLALAGVIEAALIDLSTRSKTENPYTELQSVFGGEVVVPAEVTHSFPEAAEGNLAYGFPGWIRQADVLRPIAPVLTARDDTFVIRAYGASQHAVTGNTQSSAWCEVVVQRRAEYVDSVADESSVLPGDATLSSEVNKRFGRRFSVISFRWVSPDEV